MTIGILSALGGGAVSAWAGTNGHCEIGGTEVAVADRSELMTCTGNLLVHHDYSFENGYCWDGLGVAEPFFGAFGEAFAAGPGMVECALFWMTASFWSPSDRPDVYVWAGGVSGSPGEVLVLLPQPCPFHAPFWPACGFNEIEALCCVEDEFTVGYWFNYGWECEEYVCADESGSGGNPWTCIAPGLGYPSGWQHPNAVWPHCRSLGIGATISSGPSLVESETWGAIKSLFQQ